MTKRTRKSLAPASPSSKSRRRLFAVNNPFRLNLKRKTAVAETPKLRSYSVRVTPGNSHRVVRKIKATPTPVKGQPNKVTKAKLVNSPKKKANRKTPRRKSARTVPVVTLDGPVSPPSKCSTPANHGESKSQSGKKRARGRLSASPALKGFVPLTPKTLVAKNRSGYLAPPIVVEDDTLFTVDKTGEILDLTAEGTKNTWKRLPDYTLSEGEILTDSDDEIEIIAEKASPEKPFTRSRVKTPPGNLDKRRFPAMGLRASSRSKMPHLPLNEPPPQPPSGLTNVVAGSSSCRRTGLRPIVIDGQNVAVGHSIGIGRGNGRFSSRGIDIMVEYFRKRGHDVTVFVPQFRTKSGQADDRHLLEKLLKMGVLSYTPSRTVNGVHMNSYDDRYVVQYAAVTGGVIVSNDNYEDLRLENPQVAQAIQNRLLKFTWVKDTLMFPQDPKGRYGPKLDKFLRFD